MIRMLCDYLGNAVFMRGVQAYLARHSYSNAGTTDLWRALEEE